MTWWPRKPEPAINWRLVKFVSTCVDCERDVETRLPGMLVICFDCIDARRFVDSLPYSVQDRYLAFVEQDLETR